MALLIRFGPVGPTSSRAGRVERDLTAQIVGAEKIQRNAANEEGEAQEARDNIQSLDPGATLGVWNQRVVDLPDE